jgi:hypothetical protein
MFYRDLLLVLEDLHLDFLEVSLELQALVEGVRNSTISDFKDKLT